MTCYGAWLEGGCTSYMPFISDLALASPKVFLVGTIVEALLVGIWLQLAILSRQKLLMELKLLDEFELAHFLCAFSGKLVVIGTFLIGMFPWSHFSYSHFACACCVFWGGCGYSIATAVYVQSWRSTIARESHYPSAMTPVAASACLCFFGVFVSLCAAYDARPNFFDWNWWPKLQKLAREDFRAYCSASSWHGLPWVNTCAALEWLTLGILYVAMRAGLKTEEFLLVVRERGSSLQVRLTSSSSCRPIMPQLAMHASIGPGKEQRRASSTATGAWAFLLQGRLVLHILKLLREYG